MNVRRKAPLFLKVNTTARGVHHHFGGDFAEQRHRSGADEGGNAPLLARCGTTALP
ncbi:MAG: hypothetical protein H6718_07860 [Polyangiaceae bacterium]|nr:hypothetical protein [Myxococcales bacterium]MCB9585297.1 hypothetical protein [Polyangiaceae bacterium]MCB9606686.1 hypothetical protein [Polyangiaceae bacterium]